MNATLFRFLAHEGNYRGVRVYGCVCCDVRDYKIANTFLKMIKNAYIFGFLFYAVFVLMREYISACEAHTHTQLIQNVPGSCQAFHFSVLRNYREENITKMTFLLITITTHLLSCARQPTNPSTKSVQIN